MVPLIACDLGRPRENLEAMDDFLFLQLRLYPDDSKAFFGSSK